MKAKLSFLLTLLLFLDFVAWSQKNSISPYSRFGLGAQREGKFVRNYGMAGAGIALESGIHINPINPASYHGLGLTSFEAALESSNTWLTGNEQEQFQNKTYFSHLLFGIPVIKGKWGMAFGMLPFTAVGYDYETQITPDSEVGRVTNLFEGSGGLSRLLFGHGFKVTDQLALGVNLSYLLGNLDYKERIIYDDLGESFNTRKTEKFTFGDFYLDFGVQYVMTLKEDLKLNTGITYALGDDIKSKRSFLVESYTGDIGFERIKDTVESTIDERTQVSLPSFYGIGFALIKEDKWTLALDANYSDWSTINFRDQEYSDVYTIKLGMERRRGDTRKRDGRLRNYDMRGRFGGRYGSSYVTIDGESVNEMAASIGISLYGSSRVGSQRTVRGLNFGMEVGTRGEDNGLMIQEEFVNIIFGITINDQWFIKRKYN